MKNQARLKQLLFFVADAHENTARAAQGLVAKRDLGAISANEIETYARALERELRTLQPLRVLVVPTG